MLRLLGKTIFTILLSKDLLKWPYDFTNTLKNKLTAYLKEKMHVIVLLQKMYKI